MKERIVGHRGAGVLAPENTLEALKCAADLGLRYVEFDVRLTKDNVAVISHDDNLKRCAHIDRLISQSNYDDIKDINMGVHYALADTQAKLPTFQEYLELAQKLNLHCQIELKPNDGGEELLVNIALAIVEEFYVGTEDENLPLITSFAPVCLKMFKEGAKRQYKTGILVKVEESMNWRSFAESSVCDFVHMHAVYLKEEIANDIQNAGLQINGFHLNHPGVARKAIAFGCQRFTCDIPDIFN